MKRFALTSVTLALVLTHGQAIGGPSLDGHWLLDTCTQDRANCLGFMAAARDSLRGSGSLRCVSEHARLWELQKAYIAYADEHPDDLDRPAIEVAELAFNEGPACRETSASANGY